MLQESALLLTLRRTDSSVGSFGGDGSSNDAVSMVSFSNGSTFFLCLTFVAGGDGGGLGGN